MTDRLSAHRRGEETYLATANCKMCKSTRKRYTHNAMCVHCFDACKLFLSPRYLNRLGEPLPKKTSKQTIVRDGVKYVKLPKACPHCNVHNFINAKTRQCYNCGTIR